DGQGGDVSADDLDHGAARGEERGAGARRGPAHAACHGVDDGIAKVAAATGRYLAVRSPARSSAAVHPPTLSSRQTTMSTPCNSSTRRSRATRPWRAAAVA